MVGDFLVHESLRDEPQHFIFAGREIFRRAERSAAPPERWPAVSSRICEITSSGSPRRAVKLSKRPSRQRLKPANSGSGPTAQSYRNRFDLGFSLSGVTGLRLFATDGLAIDQFEVYGSRVAAGTSLRFNQNESRRISIGAGQTRTTGGILVTGSVATAGSAITGGTLAGAAGKDLVIIQNSSQPFNVGSVIADNTSATGLTKAGNGTLSLSGLNTLTGDVSVAHGTLAAAAAGTAGANPLGANSFGRSVTVAPGATLVSTTSDAVDYGSSTVNKLALRLQGTWENNPANTAMCSPPSRRNCMSRARTFSMWMTVRRRWICS